MGQEMPLPARQMQASSLATIRGRCRRAWRRQEPSLKERWKYPTTTLTIYCLRYPTLPLRLPRTRQEDLRQLRARVQSKLPKLRQACQSLRPKQLTGRSSLRGKTPVCYRWTHPELAVQRVSSRARKRNSSSGSRRRPCLQEWPPKSAQSLRCVRSLALGGVTRR